MCLYIFLLFFFFMLVRKVRRVGCSLVVTIPMHLAEGFGIAEGDDIEFSANQNGLTMKKKAE